jgi:heat shock protein 5
MAAKSTRSKTLFWALLIALFLFVCALNVQAKAEEGKEDYGTVIGIDLGTTYSCVGGKFFFFRVVLR